MVTRANLVNASNIARQIAEANDQLEKLIAVVLSGNVAGVDISTDATLQASLQNQYATLKTQLSTLVGSLP